MPRTPVRWLCLHSVPRTHFSDLPCSVLALVLQGCGGASLTPGPLGTGATATCPAPSFSPSGAAWWLPSPPAVLGGESFALALCLEPLHRLLLCLSHPPLVSSHLPSKVRLGGLPPVSNVRLSGGPPPSHPGPAVPLFILLSELLAAGGPVLRRTPEPPGRVVLPPGQPGPTRPGGKDFPAVAGAMRESWATSAWSPLRHVHSSVVPGPDVVSASPASLTHAKHNTHENQRAKTSWRRGGSGGSGRGAEDSHGVETACFRVCCLHWGSHHGQSTACPQSGGWRPGRFLAGVGICVKPSRPSGAERSQGRPCQTPGS